MQALAEHYPQHVRTWRRRTDAALEATGYDALLVYAGHERYTFLDDQTHPFRANPHFRAWLPLERHPGCWLVHRAGERPRVLYHQPEDFWHLPPADPAGYWTLQYDVQVVRSPGAIVDHLPPGRLACIGEDVQGLLDGRTVDINPAPLLTHLHWYRARKTAYELACMREANRLAADAHRAAREAFFAGESEYGIHLAYCRACAHTDDELPYPNIVAMNEHAAVLHYQHRDRTVGESRSLLLDAGAQCAGYASDVTRTWSQGSRAFAELVTAVDALQRELCGRVAAGVAFPDLHRETHRGIGRLLRDLDLSRIDADEALARGLTAHFLPHGLGHLIGVQVHDVGGQLAGPDGSLAPPPEDFPRLRMTRTLEEDMVITVEPGVYFIELLLARLREDRALSGAVNWRAVDALRPWGGVRIEDDVRVARDGHENLTRAWLNDPA